MPRWGWSASRTIPASPVVLTHGMHRGWVAEGAPDVVERFGAHVLGSRLVPGVRVGVDDPLGSLGRLGGNHCPMWSGARGRAWLGFGGVAVPQIRTHDGAFGGQLG